MGQERHKANDKLTLTIDEDLILVAREYSINLSELMRRAILYEIERIDALHGKYRIVPGEPLYRDWER